MRYNPVDLRIQITRDKDGYWHVRSDDIPGLHLGGLDILAILSDLGPVMKDLLKVNRGIEL